MEKKYVFFWRKESPFSNWHPAKFEIDGIVFSNTEQFMMWAKAVLMHDTEKASEILATSDPRIARDLGRKVKNYNEALWNKVRFDIVYTGCRAKFSQNENLKEILLNTEGKFVEASPKDKLWGIGLDEEAAKKVPESEWPGQNLLRQVLTKVREDLAK